MDPLDGMVGLKSQDNLPPAFPMLTTYRYGSPRQPREGIRIGVARGLPRGIRREDWQKRNYFDLRLPLLSPSADLVKSYLHDKISFAVFSRKYRQEMKASPSRQVIELLAALSFSSSFSIGCFCEDESHCHRSVLKALILGERKKKGAAFSRLRKSVPEGDRERFSSPVCFAQEEE